MNIGDRVLFSALGLTNLPEPSIWSRGVACCALGVVIDQISLHRFIVRWRVSFEDANDLGDTDSLEEYLTVTQQSQRTFLRGNRVRLSQYGQRTCRHALPLAPTGTVLGPCPYNPADRYVVGWDTGAEFVCHVSYLVSASLGSTRRAVVNRNLSPEEIQRVVQSFGDLTRSANEMAERLGDAFRLTSQATDNLRDALVPPRRAKKSGRPVKPDEPVNPFKRRILR